MNSKISRVRLGTVSALLACTLNWSSVVASAPSIIDGSIDPAANSPLSIPDVDCGSKAQPTFDKRLSADFLKAVSAKGEKPAIYVDYYDATRGLLAGYQSSTGKRLAFRSVWLATGGVRAEVAHFNEQTKRIEVIVGHSRKRDPATGRAAKEFEVGGHSLLSFAAGKATINSLSGAQSSPFGEFLTSDAGTAFVEGVPALFAVLDSLSQDDRLLPLHAPLGGVLTLLQVVTGVRDSSDRSDDILGSAFAGSLRSNCEGRECRARGQHFTIHSDGLFDSLSKGRGKVTGRNKSDRCSAASYVTKASSVRIAIDSAKNGDGNCTVPGNCFGCCGEGCANPFNICTPECLGHDLCVCKWGHAACLVDVPSGGLCDGCESLVSAVWSFLVELFTRIFSPEQTEPPPDPEEYIWW